MLLVLCRHDQQESSCWCYEMRQSGGGSGSQRNWQRLDGEDVHHEVERVLPALRRGEQVGLLIVDWRAGVAAASQLDCRWGDVETGGVEAVCRDELGVGT